MNKMIASQLEVIAQATSYLESVSKKDYTAIESPRFISSAGAHMRHIIDHYQAVISGFEAGLIDYDVRERGGDFETSPDLAIKKLTEISTWVKQLSESELSQVITLATEVSVSNKNIQKVQTTVARELVFAGSHAVHHYAMIAQISFTQEVAQPREFGLAPATATFLRQENTSENIKQSHG